jgi:predicted Zn-dependent protease
MMDTYSNVFRHFGKAPLIAATLLVAACSTNPATGDKQFTGFMSPAQENSVGMQENVKVEQQFGFYSDPQLSAYVNSVGQKVTHDTERPEVQFKFYVVDSPIVNAFALPGGYIYVSRGLLALANNEAELAAVMSHETGHITARHSAERYSHGVVTSLGAAAVGALIGNSGVSQALGVGSNLYLSSYSRGQESQADSLGLRYMTRGGYDPKAMSAFLADLNEDTSLDSKLKGADGSESATYFSTHPATAERVSVTRQEAQQYPQGGTINRDQYLNTINGMIYGDSEKQGFVRGNTFFHPAIGFTFNAPDGFQIENQAEQVVAVNKSGAAMIFDFANAPGGVSPMQYLTQNWVKGEAVEAPENISVNGMSGATAAFAGNLNGSPVIIRLMAIRWGDKMARFQIAMPQNASPQLQNALKSAAYSFRALSAQEKESLKPFRLRVITASGSDTIASLSHRMAYPDMQEERFRVLNGLIPGEQVKAGQKYKIVSED